VVTILISGAGTGVGKTRVCAALARVVAKQGRRVQIVKPFQTGVMAGEPGDAQVAARLAGLENKDAITLCSYPAALAPLSAAKAAGTTFNIQEIFQEIGNLPETDVRIIEGAGGIAVPLTDDRLDWAHLAAEIDVTAVVLVVKDELGAINQARMAYSYFDTRQGHKFRRRVPCGIFLNAITPPPPEVAASTREALLQCLVPVWGELSADGLTPYLNPDLARFFK
jgi:dethiobiotin synthetase